jgi:predicted nucleotidyltransferase
LFGSCAKGNIHKDSDIDICIVSKDIVDRIDDGGKMFALTWGIDTRIEPYPINTKDFNKKDTPIINEIINTGHLLV